MIIKVKVKFEAGQKVWHITDCEEPMLIVGWQIEPTDIDGYYVVTYFCATKHETLRCKEMELLDSPVVF